MPVGLCVRSPPDAIAITQNRNENAQEKVMDIYNLDPFSRHRKGGNEKIEVEISANPSRRGWKRVTLYPKKPLPERRLVPHLEGIRANAWEWTFFILEQIIPELNDRVFFRIRGGIMPVYIGGEEGCVPTIESSSNYTKISVTVTRKFISFFWPLPRKLSTERPGRYADRPIATHYINGRPKRLVASKYTGYYLV